MNRKLSAALVAASVLAAGTASAGDDKDCKEKDGQHCIRFATLAPSQSPWGKWFNEWKKAAEAKSEGKLKVTWYWNGTQGPEPAVVGKIRSGNLTGAAITAVGLAQIYAPINALQMPGAFDSWAELDTARNAMKDEFNAKLQEAGFYVSGWGDVGRARTMSKGFAVKTPEDLAGRAPGYLEGDKIGPKVFEAINQELKKKNLSQMTAKSTQVMEILSNLQQGSINVLTTPALAAEQLQWTSRLDHINTHVVSYGVGAMVISQKELDKLPNDLKTMMQDLGKKTSDKLALEIRAKDDQAYDRSLKKMTVYDPTPAEKEAFKVKYKAACDPVGGALEGKKWKDSVLGKLKVKACQ